MIELEFSLIDLISKEEKYLIENHIKERVDYRHSTPDCTMASVEYLLREWDSQKRKMFKLLGGQDLIISKEFYYEKSIDELQVDCEELKDCDFIRQMRELAWGGMLSRDFIYIVTNYTLATNLYDGYEDLSYIDPKTGKTNTFRPGIKLLKILSKIAESFNLQESFEDFRIRHSQILNDRKMKGELCFSIHPLDFITMSDNNSDWNSCMSWWDSGEYCQGTVEMMNSPCVVIAYLASAHNMSMYGGYEWNNKKWRELFIIDENVISEIRSYPYRNEDLSKHCLRFLASLAEKNLDYEYELDCYTMEADCGFNISDRNIHIDFETRNMYNDFCHTHCFHLGMGVSRGDRISVHYSGASECMWCGTLNPYLEDESCILCESCNDSIRCCDCGTWMNEEDVYSVNGDCFCESCYNYYCRTCAVTEDRYHLSEMKEIHLMSDEMDYISSDKHCTFFIGPDATIGEFMKEYCRKGAKCYEVQTDYQGFYKAVKWSDLKQNAFDWLDLDPEEKNFFTEPFYRFERVAKFLN